MSDLTNERTEQKSVVRLLIIGLMMLIGVAAGWWWLQRSTSTLTEPRVTFDDRHVFRLMLADTPAKQVQGLAGVNELADDVGMYFPLEPALPTSFWMKGMVMDIDIIWLKDDKVVQVDANVPAPLEGQTDGELPRYSSMVDEPDGVVEIRAGRAAELGIEPGSLVRLHLPE